MALPPGTVLLGRYRIERVLGQGGFGAVYLAFDEILEQPCAVKENRSLSSEGGRQFLKEARLLANLRHPNLPRVTHHFEIGKSQFLVMDFVEGEDLAQLMGRADSPRLEEVLRWARQIGGALTYLHGLDPPVFHRDIKPANIKITPQGQAILVDFGIAKEGVPDQATSTGAKGVTPGYGPPEQYGLGHTDARTDVYALGATLYALVTGKSPPDSVQRLLGTVELASPETITPDLPPHVVRAIQLAMRPRKEDRPPDIATLIRLLGDPGFNWLPARTAAEEEREAHALRLAARRQRRRERPWVVVGMAIVVFSLCVFAVGAHADIAHWAEPMLRQAGLLAPELPAAPPVGISSVGFPTATRTLEPTSSPGTTLPRTATSIPSPTSIPVVADVRNGIMWRSYASWTWDEPSLIFSMAPDGETAVVVSGESIDLVDPVTGEVKQSLPSFLVGRTAYAVAQRGSTILVGVEGEIQRFDLRSNNPLTPLPIPGTELRLSPSGNLLAVRDKYITLLNLETGKRLKGLGETNTNQPFAISPNDRTFALAEGVAVALWDLEKGVSEGRLEGHGELVEGLAFTRDGNRLVSASGDVWDLATGELTAVFDSATDQIVLSPNGQLIIGGDGSVWDLATGDLIGKIPFEKGTPGTLLFTSDGRFLIRTVGIQAQIWVADPDAASRTAQESAVEEIEGEAISDLNLYRLVRGEPLDHDGYGGFDVRPDGRAAAAWNGRTVRVFDLQDETPLAEFALEGTVTDAAFLGDDFLVVVVNETRTERWEVSSGRPLQTYAVGGGQIEASPAGDYFAVRAKYIQVVDALSGAIVIRLGSADASQDFQFTPDGRHLLIAAGPGVGVWDVESGALTQQLAGHGLTVTGLRVTSDGRRAAAASGDVWDLERARPLASFGTTAGKIALSDDGRLVIDSEGVIWNAATGFMIGRLDTRMNDLAFALDDRALIGLGSGSLLLVYRLAPIEAPFVSEVPALPGNSAGLTAGNLTGIGLLGWWGPDDLLSVRFGRDGVPPGARAYGTDTYQAVVPSPDGWTVTALRPEGVDLLDPARGTVAASLRMFLNPSWIEDIAYAGTDLLVAKGAAGVERWDLPGQRLLQRYEVEGEAVAASPDRTRLAVQHGSRLQVLDLASGEVVLRDLTVSPGGQRFAFAPDSQTLAVAHGSFVDIWDLAERRRVLILRGQEPSVGGLVFQPDGARLAAASGAVWDLAGGQRLVEFDSPSEVGSLVADGTFLIEGAGGVWSTDDGERVATLFDLRALGEQIALTGSGSALVLRSAAGNLSVWSVRPLAPPPEVTPAAQAIAAANAPDLRRVDHLGRGRLKEALWSPDDSYLAVNTTLNAIVYEAETLRRLRAFEAAEVVAFDSEGNVLVGGDQPLQRIEPSTGAVLEDYGLVGIHAASYSPDGAWLALAGRVSSESRGDGLALMALADGLLRVLDPGRNLATEIDGLEFTSDSRRLVASHPLAISLWDVATGVQVRDPIAGTRRRASLSPDGSRIAYQTSNAIVVESLQTGATFRRLKADGTDFFPTGVDIPRLEPVDIAFLENTDLVVFFRRVDRNTGDAVGAVVLLDLQAMTGVWRDRSLMDLSRPVGEYTEAYDTARPPVIPSFGLSPSGRRLFSLTSDGVIRVWDVAGQRMAETEPEYLDEMALSPDGDTLVVADALGGLEVIDPTSGEVVRRLPGAWYPRLMAFGSRSLLAVLQEDGTVSQVDVGEGRVVERCAIEGWSAGDRLATSRDGRLLAVFRSFAGENRVLVFSLCPDRPLLDLGRFPRLVEPIFAPDGTTLAVVRRETVELWDLQRGVVGRQIDGAGEGAGIMRFAPDGDQLITGTGEIWQIGDGKVGSLEASLGPFDVSPNGEVLVTNDGFLWDARDGRSLGRLEGVLETAVQIAFTPDGRSLLWMRPGGVVEIWQVAP